MVDYFPDFDTLENELPAILLYTLGFLAKNAVREG